MAFDGVGAGGGGDGERTCERATETETKRVQSTTADEKGRMKKNEIKAKR